MKILSVHGHCSIAEFILKVQAEALCYAILRKYLKPAVRVKAAAGIKAADRTADGPVAGFVRELHKGNGELLIMMNRKMKRILAEDSGSCFCRRSHYFKRRTEHAWCTGYGIGRGYGFC